LNWGGLSVLCGLVAIAAVAPWWATAGAVVLVAVAFSRSRRR
jgi:hypothetical protein